MIKKWILTFRMNRTFGEINKKRIYILIILFLLIIISFGYNTQKYINAFLLYFLNKTVEKRNHNIFSENKIFSDCCLESFYFFYKKYYKVNIIWVLVWKSRFLSFFLFLFHVMKLLIICFNFMTCRNWNIICESYWPKW